MRKNWGKVSRLVLLYSGCFAAIPVKCNSIFEKSKKAPDDGYEYVTETGSMVPHRVKKGESPVTTSPVNSMSAEQFDKIRQRLGQQNQPKSTP